MILNICEQMRIDDYDGARAHAMYALQEDGDNIAALNVLCAISLAVCLQWIMITWAQH